MIKVVISEFIIDVDMLSTTDWNSTSGVCTRSLSAKSATPISIIGLSNVKEMLGKGTPCYNCFLSTLEF